MNQRLKQVLLGFMILLTTVVLVACTNTEQQLDKALEGITITYAEGDSQTSVTKDIVLPEKSGNIEITWTSKNPGAINANGKVIQSTKDVNVELVAVATKGEETKNKSFNLTVKLSSDSVLTTAKDRLNIAGVSNGNVNTPTIELADKVVIEGSEVAVTWATSDALRITTDGNVYRPAFGTPDASVKLTATLTFDGKTETKVFDLLVLAKTVQPVVSGTIEAIHTKNQNDIWVVAEKVTVVALTDDGLYISDASQDKGTALFVHTNAAPAKTIKVGDVVDVEGLYTQYFFALQIAKGTTEPVSISPAVGTAIEFEAIEDEPANAIQEINKRKLPSATSVLINELIVVEGMVMTDGEEGNYDTFMMPVEGFDGKLNKKNAIMFYYKGNKTAVKEFAGKKVRLEVMVHAYRTNDNVWTVNFVGTSADITELELTPKEKINAAKGDVLQGLPAEIIKDVEALKLLQKVGDVTVTWESSHPEIIANDGKVNLPAEGREVVTLTATLKNGEITDTVVHEINVGKLAVSTIADVRHAKNSPEKLFYKVTGVVTAVAGNNMYAIQDATGALAVFDNKEAGKTLKANIGKEVTITGIKTIFNGLVQLGNIDLIEDISTEAVEVAATNINSMLGNNNTLLNHQAKIVEVKDAFVTVVKPGTGGSGENEYKTLELTLFVNGKTINARMDGRAFTGETTVLDAIKVGDVVTVTAPLGWYNNPQIALTDAKQVVVAAATEAKDVEFALIMLNTRIAVDGKDVVDLPKTGERGTTVTWTSSSTDAVIANDKVTYANVTAITKVVLTATVKKGAVTETKAFNVSISVWVESVLGYNLVTDKGSNSYNPQEVLLVNSVKDGADVSAKLNRVSINTTAGMTGLVISPRNNVSATAELAVTENIKQIGFKASYWNAYAKTKYVSFNLEVKVGEDWVSVLDILATDLPVAEENELVKVAITQADVKEFRFVGVAPAGYNDDNNVRIIITNIQIFN